jgi:hypothetical protein
MAVAGLETEQAALRLLEKEYQYTHDLIRFVPSGSDTKFDGGLLTGVWDGKEPVGLIGVVTRGNEAICHNPLDEKIASFEQPPKWNKAWEGLAEFAKEMSPEGSGFIFNGITSQTMVHTYLLVYSELLSKPQLSHVVFYGRGFMSAIPQKYCPGAARITTTEGKSGDTPLEIISIPLAAYQLGKAEKKTDG